MKQLTVRTGSRTELVDISRLVARAVEEERWLDGAVLVSSPHTTAGILVNEGADPDVARDILAVLQRLAPPQDPLYRHREGNSDSHAKTALVGTSALVPVAGGRLQLGTWQSIFLAEFDGPRTRTVWLTFLSGGPA